MKTKLALQLTIEIEHTPEMPKEYMEKLALDTISTTKITGGSVDWGGYKARVVDWDGLGVVEE